MSACSFFALVLVGVRFVRSALSLSLSLSMAFSISDSPSLHLCSPGLHNRSVPPNRVETLHFLPASTQETRQQAEADPSASAHLSSPPFFWSFRHSCVHISLSLSLLSPLFFPCSFLYSSFPKLASLFLSLSLYSPFLSFWSRSFCSFFFFSPLFIPRSFLALPSAASAFLTALRPACQLHFP